MLALKHILLAELLKLKKSTAIWLSIIFGLILPFFVLILYLVGPEGYTARMNTNPWPNYLIILLSLFSFGLFPLLVICITSAVWRMEYRANSWKQLFVVAIPKWQILLGKLLVILFFLMGSMLLFIASSFAFPYLISAIHPETEFYFYTPDISLFLENNYYLFTVGLGILGIHFTLCLIFKNQIYPIIFGIVLLVLGFLMPILNPKIAPFFPYSFPMIYKDFGIGTSVITGDLKEYQFLLKLLQLKSIGVLAISVFLSYFLFKSKY